MRKQYRVIEHYPNGAKCAGTYSSEEECLAKIEELEALSKKWGVTPPEEYELRVIISREEAIE